MAKPYRPKRQKRVNGKKVDTSRTNQEYWDRLLYDLGMGRQNEMPSIVLFTRGKSMRRKTIDPTVT